jgi:hypothetical protein
VQHSRAGSAGCAYLMQVRSLALHSWVALQPSGVGGSAL